LEWLKKSKGKGYQNYLNAILRSEMQKELQTLTMNTKPIRHLLGISGGKDNVSYLFGSEQTAFQF
jgi:hypothetical protein